MIIICPSGKKKFEVDSNQIPEKGRIYNVDHVIKLGFTILNLKQISIQIG